MHVTLVEINVKPDMVERFKEVFLLTTLVP